MHPASVQIDRLHLCLDELDAIEHRPDRIDRVARFENARAGFKEQRRHQKEIVAADERDLDRGIAPPDVLEMQRSVNPRKTTAEDDDVRLTRRVRSDAGTINWRGLNVEGGFLGCLRFPGSGSPDSKQLDPQSRKRGANLVTTTACPSRPLRFWPRVAQQVIKDPFGRLGKGRIPGIDRRVPSVVRSRESSFSNASCPTIPGKSLSHSGRRAIARCPCRVGRHVIHPRASSPRPASSTRCR